MYTRTFKLTLLSIALIISSNFASAAEKDFRVFITKIIQFEGIDSPLSLGSGTVANGTQKYVLTMWN